MDCLSPVVVVGCKRLSNFLLLMSHRLDLSVPQRIMKKYCNYINSQPTHKAPSNIVAMFDTCFSVHISPTVEYHSNRVFGCLFRQCMLKLGDPNFHFRHRLGSIPVGCCCMILLRLKTRWWFQIFFIFTPTWGRFPFWLILFKWVETTN